MSRRVAAVQVALAVAVVLAGCPTLDGGQTTADKSATDRAGRPATTTQSSPADATTDSDSQSGRSTPAGTDAPGQTPTTAGTATGRPPTGEYAVPVRGNLSVNATLVYERVRRLTGTDATPPVVDVLPPQDREPGYRFSGFKRAMGLQMSTFRKPDWSGGVGGRTLRSGIVLYVDANASAATVERTLVHEFVHAIQYDAGMLRTLSRQGSGTTDGFLVRRAITEGSATYVEDEYVTRYGDGPTESARYRDQYADWSGATQYGLAPYYFGSRYVDSRVDSPSEIDAVFQRPPNTTEQLLHNRSARAEPPAPLSVRVALDQSSYVETDQRNVMGELFTRIALSTALPENRSARAAAGWGNDTLVTLSDGGPDDYVWVVRWDDTANATEFEGALRAYLDARGQRTDGAWRADGHRFDVRRAGNRTVALVVGSQSFVDDVTVAGDRNVTVTVE